MARSGRRWGTWRFDAELLTLTHFGRYRYEIDLESCVDSAQVLDWVAQISRKTWATAKDVGGLVAALDALLDLQGRVCSGGFDRKSTNPDLVAHLDRATVS